MSFFFWYTFEISGAIRFPNEIKKLKMKVYWKKKYHHHHIVILDLHHRHQLSVNQHLDFLQANENKILDHLLHQYHHAFL
jgi:hypothetical protein